MPQPSVWLAFNGEPDHHRVEQKRSPFFRDKEAKGLCFCYRDRSSSGRAAAESRFFGSLFKEQLLLWLTLPIVAFRSDWRDVWPRLILVLVMTYPFGLSTCLAAARTVGFQQVKMPNASGMVLEGAFWYPSNAAAAPMDIGNTRQVVAIDAPLTGDHLPLVVLSHGAFGNWTDHADLAVALAKAGFVVAAASYHQFSRKRVLQISAWVSGIRQVIDYALQRWPEHVRVDASRIGAFGFSVGGTATLIAVGARPNPSLARPHCKMAPQDWSCLHATGIDLMLNPPPRTDTWVPDDRVKAVVLEAPAMGFIFGRSGLSAVRVPVQLWKAGRDQVLNPRWNSQPIVANLAQPPDVRIAAMADHPDFVAPCSAEVSARWSGLCRDTWEFDRAKFHAYLDDTIAMFFLRTLAFPRSPVPEPPRQPDQKF